MSVGNIAALVAAIAFAVLVVFICLTLFKLADVIKELKQTVIRINDALSVVTKDVDHISVEVEGLLNKANGLMADVNGKLEKTDPLFVAVGDVGESISNLNDSTKSMTNHLVGKTKRRTASLNRLVSVLKKDKTQKTESEVATELASSSAEVNDSVKRLEKLEEIRPSQTAGEITLKERGE